jgi:UMF1 family MFS transporter
MNIVTLYFAVWLVTERGGTNTAYSIATSLSSVAVLFAAPWVGAVSDATSRRKPWVVGLTLVCVAATVSLAPLGRGTSAGAALLPLLAAFAIANTAYQLALTPYNAMLPELVPAEERGRLSGLGTAVGYAGSIAGVLLVAPFVTGGLGIRAGGRAASFVPTAALFLLFSLPFFVFCRDRRPVPPAGGGGRDSPTSSASSARRSAARAGTPGSSASSRRRTSTRTRSGPRSRSWRSTRSPCSGCPRVARSVSSSC